jgi:hypothetical protein
VIFSLWALDAVAADPRAAEASPPWHAAALGTGPATTATVEAK